MRKDRGAPGLVGRLTIGVRTGVLTEWLQITLGAAAEAERVEVPDPTSDAIMLLGDREAESIVDRGCLPHTQRRNA